MKFTGYEAQGIEPLVGHNPLLGWMYRIWTVRQFAVGLGVVEISIAILIALRPWSRKASAIGSAAAVLMFLTTLSLAAVKTALAGQGYEIVTRAGLTVEEVLALSPEVLVTEATPSDLSCCGLITQLKSRADYGLSLKVVMIVHGGALERARALDLGTDDVISFPFNAVEFAAKIRTRFREHWPEEALKTMIDYAEQRRHYADAAGDSLSGASERRFLLIPVLFALSAMTALAAVFMGISTHGSRKNTLKQLPPD